MTATVGRAIDLRDKLLRVNPAKSVSTIYLLFVSIYGKTLPGQSGKVCKHRIRNLVYHVRDNPIKHNLCEVYSPDITRESILKLSHGICKARDPSMEYERLLPCYSKRLRQRSWLIAMPITPSRPSHK